MIDFDRLRLAADREDLVARRARLLDALSEVDLRIQEADELLDGPRGLVVTTLSEEETDRVRSLLQGPESAS